MSKNSAGLQPAHLFNTPLQVCHSVAHLVWHRILQLLTHGNFRKPVTPHKTCAKLARTQRTPCLPNTCKSVVPQLCANLRQTCAKLAPDLRRRARGAPKGSLAAPGDFGKTHEGHDEGGLRTSPCVLHARVRDDNGSPVPNTAGTALPEWQDSPSAHVGW
jgi:hypothetical protein